MKNDVMEAAVTGIDNKLILDAQTAPKSKSRFRPVYALCALAACMVLVFTFIFAFPADKGTQLLVNGNEISDTPVVISLPAAARSIEITTEVSIPLTLRTDKETSLSVSQGTMEIYSSDTNTHLFTGSQHTVNEPVNVYWVIDGSDINKSYSLELNGGETVYELSYNESTGNYSICKQ